MKTHLNILTSPSSPPQHSTNNNESAEYPRSRRTSNQATRNLNSVTPVHPTNHEHLASNNPQPPLRAQHSHPTSTQQHTLPQHQVSSPQVVPPQYAFPQGVTPNWAHPQQGVTPNVAYPAMLHLFAQMFNASMLYTQQRPIARAKIPEQTQYAHTATTLYICVLKQRHLGTITHFWLLNDASAN